MKKVLGFGMICGNPDCPHAVRTGEPAEYRDGIRECQDCGAALVEADTLATDTVAYEEFVPIREILNAAVVPFVASLLSSEGIRYFIKGEGVQDFFGWGRLVSGFNLITGPPVVYVEPDRADEARDLLADVEDAPESEGSQDGDDTA